MAEFEVAHRTDHKKIMMYAERARLGSQKPATWVARDMEPQYAKYLNANNAEGRITFTQTLLKHMREHAAVLVEPLHFVTVVSRVYMLPIGTAAEINLKSLRAFVRQALVGSPFVGMIEPALYLDCNTFGACRGVDVVCWHAHIIVWGRTRQQIRKAASGIGAQHVSITGGPPVHIKYVSPDELTAKWLYMCKAPLKAYRLNRYKGERIDASTGEVFQNFLQQKQPMRTGNRIRVSNFMKDLYLEQLCFGGGEGAALAKTIIKTATVTKRLEAARETSKRLAQRAIQNSRGAASRHH